MSAPTVRISESSRQVLRHLAETSGKSMQEILEQALEEYRRKIFLEGLAADYAALRADPKAWADELEERKLWEPTLMDGLDPDEHWTLEGKVRRKKRSKTR